MPKGPITPSSKAQILQRQLGHDGRRTAATASRWDAGTAPWLDGLPMDRPSKSTDSTGNFCQVVGASWIQTLSWLMTWEESPQKARNHCHTFWKVDLRDLRVNSTEVDRSRLWHSTLPCLMGFQVRWWVPRCPMTQSWPLVAGRNFILRQSLCRMCAFGMYMLQKLQTKYILYCVSKC